MSNFNSIKFLEVLDRTFRKKYDKKANLEEVGIAYSGASAILNYKDGDMQITAKVSKKAAIQMYFDAEKTAGKFKNIDFDKFKEKFETGVPIEEIEEVIKKEQLPLS